MSNALLSVAELETFLHRTVASRDTAAAQFCCDLADALVTDVIGFSIMAANITARPTDILVVKAVAVRVAMTLFTNPEDRASFAGPDGMSFTPSPQILSRLISESDRRTLVSVQLNYAPGVA